jgi:hypothetical protein
LKLAFVVDDPCGFGYVYYLFHSAHLTELYPIPDRWYSAER